MCALHRVLASKLETGARLCTLTAYESAKRFRARLSTVGMEKASKVGFKAFRAGRATSWSTVVQLQYEVNA